MVSFNWALLFPVHQQEPTALGFSGNHDADTERQITMIFLLVFCSYYCCAMDVPLEHAMAMLDKAQAHAKYKYSHYKQIRAQKIANTVNIQCAFGKVKHSRPNDKSSSGKEYFCEECKAGTRKQDEDGCEKCPPGRYQRTPGTESCIDCAAGFYQHRDGVSVVVVVHALVELDFDCSARQQLPCYDI